VTTKRTKLRPYEKNGLGEGKEQENACHTIRDE
jgi:hypothetical protein